MSGYGWRHRLMGLRTVLGLSNEGYFIPYRHAGQMPDRDLRDRYAALEPLFEAASKAHLDLINDFNKYKQDTDKIGENNPPEPRWNQTWFPRLDAMAAYTMVREQRPSRIVEIGSGHSTRFMSRAVRDGSLGTQITAIDPAPRAVIAGLPIDIQQVLVHDAPADQFDQLGRNDILFIDSSHILMPGTDVDYLFNHIMPRLGPGVIIHIHDILLPDEYPPAWEWRGYNEQQGVAALLQGGGYEILFSSHYAATRLSDHVSRSAVAELPLDDQAFETSLWLRKLG